MNTAKEFITEYSDQARDIFEHFNAVPHFSATEKKNPFGGNPEYVLHLSIDWKLPMKEVDFKHAPATETKEAFHNRIRAYLFSCVDAFVNL